MNIASAVILCTIVGAVGAIILVAAAKFMAVEEDPRIEEVASCLAGANCGGCGYAGCADYAKAVVMDGVPCDKCAPGGPKAAAAIAKIMGGEASAVEKKAVVQCQGSSEHCKPAYDYKGIQTCAAAATLYGGPKTCSFACVGLGDCTKVCKFDAIHIVDGVAKVDKDKCTGCGACANICPKQVIMIDVGGPRKPVVMCSNKDKGPVAMKACTTSCIACGMCERTCKFDAIHVVNNVAVIDYTKCKGCTMCAKACPRNAIEPIPTPEEKEKFKAAQKAAAEKKAAAEAAAAALERYQAGESLSVIAADYESTGSYSSVDAGSNNGSALSTWVFDKARTSGESAVVTGDPNSYVVVFHSVGRQEYKTVDVRHILFQVSTSDLDSSSDTYDTDLATRKDEAKAKAEPNTVFGGRLGTYKYYDMHNVIDTALTAYEEQVAPLLKK